MATNKNITMKQYNGVDYDTLYPKTIASQIDDVYSKDEMSNLFLPKAGGSMGGILDMNGNRITNLPTPTSSSEPATKEYVDGKVPYDYLNEFGIPEEIDIYCGSSSRGIIGTGTIRNYLGYCIVNLNLTSAVVDERWQTFYKDSSLTNLVNPQIDSTDLLYVGIGDIELAISASRRELMIGEGQVGARKCVLPFNCN